MPSKWFSSFRTSKNCSHTSKNLRTVRSTVGGFPNNVRHMSSGKILATVLNVRSVRIDDQFKTFICECSQYWQFMTSMALIQYKTYICGMFCCYFLLYINIFFFLETVRIRSAGVVDHHVDSIYPQSCAHCTSFEWTYCTCKKALYLVWRSRDYDYYQFSHFLSARVNHLSS